MAPAGEGEGRKEANFAHGTRDVSPGPRDRSRAGLRLTKSVTIPASWSATYVLGKQKAGNTLVRFDEGGSRPTHLATLPQALFSLSSNRRAFRKIRCRSFLQPVNANRSDCRSSNPKRADNRRWKTEDGLTRRRDAQNAPRPQPAARRS